MSWGEVLKINSDMSKSLDILIDEKIKTLLSEILNSKNTINSGILNLSSNTQSMLNNPKVVKSVQRGVLTEQQIGFGNKSVSISSVNPNKSIFIYNTYERFEENTRIIYIGSFATLTSSNISFGINYKDLGSEIRYFSYTWQVIEFY